MDKEEEEKLPLDSTPIQKCAAALYRVSEFWDEVTLKMESEPGLFLEHVFGEIWRDGDTGEKYEEELDRWDEQPDDMKPLALLQVAFVCTAYACQGMKAQKDNDMVRAWQYTAKCQYWLGILIGAWSIRSTQESPAKSFAKLGADAAHAENRAMKAQVIAWYLENADTLKSKDEAAAQAAGKIVPVKFRTVRDWLKGV